MKTVALTPEARAVRLRAWTAPDDVAELTCDRRETSLEDNACPRCRSEDADEQARLEAGRDERSFE